MLKLNYAWGRGIAAVAPAVLLLLLGISAPAAAQVRGGPEDRAAPGPLDGEPAERPDDTAVQLEPVAIEALHNFSACIVNRNPQAASEVLGMDFRTLGYRRALGHLARGHDMCAVNSKLKFSGILLAGGMAEALLDRGDLAQLPARLAFRDGDAAVEARSETEYTGLCLVRKAPDAVASLLATQPAGSDELTRFHPITELLPGCVSKGMHARFNRPGLRAVVALAAYRIAQTHTGTN